MDASLLYAGTFAGRRHVPFHRHDGDELVLLERGRCDINVGATTLALRPLDLAILPRDLAHDQRNHGSVRTSYGVFRCDAFDAAPRVCRLSRDDPLPIWLRQLASLGQGPDPAPGASLDGLMGVLLEWLAHREHRAQALQDEHPALRRACGIIEEEYARPLAVEELAARSGVSASHLSLLFRRRFGHGPAHHHQELRLEQACRLLRNRYLKIHEVAEACGFEDANYFSRAFRRRYRVSPGRWRERYAGRAVERS